MAGVALGAFAQGTVVFENSAGTGNVQEVGGPTPSGAVPAGTYDVALLYSSAGTTGVAQSSLTQVAFYAVTAGGNNGPGYFYDGTVTTPATGTATFEVVGWSTGGSQTTYTTWASVLAAGGAGLNYWTSSPNLVEFTQGQGNPGGTPATPAVALSGGTGSGWNGNLVLTPVPEPTTIALGGIGAAALLLFRRKK